MDRLQVLSFFEQAPEDAVFDQKVISFVRDCSTSTLERDRFVGQGIPFVKIGRLVRYRKSDVVGWLNQHQPRTSTVYN